MNKNAPCREEWKNLYDPAIKFKGLAPWRWMDDSTVFGVENPKNSEIGYCCVTGLPGEVPVMAVYPGSEGLEVYKKIQSEKLLPEDENAGLIQKCPTITFSRNAGI